MLNYFVKFKQILKNTPPPKKKMKSILDSKNVTHKQVDYAQLLDYIFTKNNNKRCFLQTPQLNNTKELFCFCLDLFCKGILICHGKETNSVNLEELSLDQLKLVIDKLSMTGIMTIIEMQQLKDEDKDVDDDEDDDEDDEENKQVLNKKDAKEILQNSLTNIYANDNNALLSSFKFDLQVRDFMYIIRFEIQM
jgi:hypothetical protein